jgi:hypothetical protein
MFRRVANDVYDQTGGKQRPQITSWLRTDYVLNPTESDSAAWSRVRESTNPADFKEFIQKFPASPFAREAQFRIDLFDRIRREKEEDRKKPKILETGYSLLKYLGGEEPGYGLYSYAILVNNDDRSAKFLGHVFGDGRGTIPPVEETAAPRSRTNIFYIPMINVTSDESLKELYRKKDDRSGFIAAYAKKFYDYKMSRALLDHLCDSPAEEISAACEGDLSRGPYIFAYAKPASKVTPVPPPFLFMDLSDVHERAFPEIIAAFKAQVKREDISDRAKIDTLRLKVLSIALTAADWLVPVQKALADIVYSPAGQTEKDKK